MPKSKAHIGWLPADLLEEAAAVKVKLGLPRTADALRLVASYSKMGREVESLSKALGLGSIKIKR